MSNNFAGLKVGVIYNLVGLKLNDHMKFNSASFKAHVSFYSVELKVCVNFNSARFKVDMSFVPTRLKVHVSCCHYFASSVFLLLSISILFYFLSSLEPLNHLKTNMYRIVIWWPIHLLIFRRLSIVLSLFLLFFFVNFGDLFEWKPICAGVLWFIYISTAIEDPIIKRGDIILLTGLMPSHFCACP